MIIKQLTVGMMGVCCYVVKCEETGKGIVIDPGGDEEKILTTLEEEKISLQFIVNTHGHPDHVCGNKVIQNTTGAKIVMHEEDVKFFERPEIDQFFSQLGLPGSPPVDMPVKDGDILAVGNLNFKIIHTPGHTPGGMCLYSKPNLFSGDTLFAGGVGRTDFPGGDTKQFLAAIKDRLLILPEDTIVWPGHGYGGSRSTIGEEKRSNPFLTGSW